MLLGIILVILFLSVLVLLHEAGHFLMAKKFGVFVEEFGIGLPPRIWGKKIGETVYSLNALPFGGFVKIFGENGMEENLAESDSIKVEAVSEELTVSGNEIEIKEELLSAEIGVPRKKQFGELKIWKRTVILVAGVMLNFVFGWILISSVFISGAPESLIIAGVAKNSPAASAGILAGDKLISAKTETEIIEGSIKTKEFVAFIDRNKGEEVSFRIERKNDIKEIKSVPRENPPKGEGALGVSLMEAGFAKKPFFESLSEGFKTSVRMVKEVYVSVFDMAGKALAGKSGLSQVTGPVGIVRTASETNSLGIIYLIQLLAMISLNLAALNFFPFPALDGGRVLFLIIEKIKGSPLPKKIENYANAFGMMILLALMAIVTIKDILNII